MIKSRLRTGLISIGLSLVTLNGAYAAKETSYSEEDIEAGRVVSTQCAVCHGQDGEGNGIPKSKISGMKAERFIKIIHDFKSGARKSVMQRFVSDLTEEEIENVAAYYATRR